MLFITGSPHNIQSVLDSCLKAGFSHVLGAILRGDNMGKNEKLFQVYPILQIELKNTIEFSSLRNQLD
jgi:hypothetical protein